MTVLFIILGEYFLSLIDREKFISSPRGEPVLGETFCECFVAFFDICYTIYSGDMSVIATFFLKVGDLPFGL